MVLVIIAIIAGLGLLAFGLRVLLNFLKDLKDINESIRQNYEDD